MISQDLLYRFEEGLDPKAPEDSGIPARIMGYGEMSAIFRLEADKTNVYKRMPLFGTLAQAMAYRSIYLEYCRRLEKAGLCLPSHDTAIIKLPGRPAVLYISQKKLPSAQFAHQLIHHPDPTDLESGLGIIRQVARETNKVWEFNKTHQPQICLAIDGQLSNWVRDTDRPDILYYIDTSTPLFQINGIEQLDPELLLQSAPGFLRWMIRLFFLQGVMTRYYVPELVFTDLIANLYKEQKPELIGPALEIINSHLSGTTAPLTMAGVESYYREDKLIWTLFLGLRRLDRFMTTRIFKKRYEFILPGKIKR